MQNLFNNCDINSLFLFYMQLKVYIWLSIYLFMIIYEYQINRNKVEQHQRSQYWIFWHACYYFHSVTKETTFHWVNNSFSKGLLLFLSEPCVHYLEIKGGADNFIKTLISTCESGALRIFSAMIFFSTLRCLKILMELLFWFSRPEVFCKKVVLENIRKFTIKILC